MIFLTLFLEFFKIGLFSVGGGLATIPFLMELAGKYDWLTHEMLTDMIAVSEATPGPIGINLATYSGFAAAGVPGALVASFSIVLPSFITISIIAKVLQKFRQNPLVDSVFSGIRPVVTGLIAAAGMSVLKVSIFSADMSSGLGETITSVDIPMRVLFILILVVSNIKQLKKLHPIVFISIGAAAGIGINYLLR